MLDKIRTHATSWVIKTILALMGVGLIFFFGISQFQRIPNLSGRSGTAAVVNGEIIPVGKLEWALENQKSRLREMFKGSDLPATFFEGMKSQVLEELIQRKLFAQQAKTLGLQVSDKELSDRIVQIYSQEGAFDKNAYLKSKPNYKLRTGEDYEVSLREDLLASKFEDFIRDSIQISDQDLKQEFLYQKTELNLQKITLDSSQWKEKEEVENHLKDFQSELKTAFTESAPAKEKGAPKISPLEALKKKYNLKMEETGFHSLKSKAGFTGDPKSDEAFQCILKMTSENPFCFHGYLIDGKTVYFKLIEQKQADLSKFPEVKDQIRSTLLGQRQIAILNEVTDSLSNHASIQRETIKE